MDGATVSLVTEDGIQTDDENPENLIEKLSTIGKIVIDKQVRGIGLRKNFLYLFKPLPHNTAF